MKTRITLMTLLLLLATVFLFGSTKNSAAGKLLKKAKEISKEAFIKYDANLFKQSIGLCERVLSAEHNNSLAKYYLAYNQYRLLLMPTKNGKDNLFDTYYEQAVENAKTVARQNELKPEANILLSALYMMQLSKNQAEAPTISAKIYKLLGQAQSNNPQNPRIYLVKGIMLFHTPKMFGGSVEKALTNFKKAARLFESSKQGFVDWGYLETLAWEGQSLQRLKKYSEAESVYKKSLKIEPEFKWVKYVLLPNLQRQDSLLTSKTNNSNKDIANITVDIKGFNNNKGKVRIGLYNSEKNYDNGKIFRARALKIQDKTVECTFDNIPYGNYAIKFYHDENNNDKLDKNMFGIPKEGYGFSNNAAGSFGPASYEDAMFAVKKSTVIVKMDVQ